MCDAFTDLVGVVAWWRGGRTDLNDKYTAASKNGATAEDAYIDSIYKILIVVCVTGSFVFMVRTNPRDRFEKGYHHSLFGKRVISIKFKNTTANQNGSMQNEM
ncbi:hypothetical protein KXD40_004804 [Peronospora effusa]|uniref:Uncharacterized protein n=1 Tax=Peronospora effusa TaxID=542832 RepID=A0A3M6VDF1_9STRA|nr:hypothetical protein DD238_008313 [Peronospora effusa]RQM12076.1 hypothetical protein DD237_004923 [Peronospora effusa]UIZ22620.1 hypothetical protein KXD40_004804 [Peronospora effusa]CAI5709124.1 unnamed protein product [Peronospora effusa]